MISVATPVSNRPEYLRQTLKSWELARGVQRVNFVFSLEPCTERQENIDVISNFQKRTQTLVTLLMPPMIQGPAKNHYTALHTAFSIGASHLILGEEDITVSADAIEYMEWGFDKQKQSLNIGLVCGYSTRDEGLPETVRKVSGFPNCWLWGTSRFWWEHYVGRYWDSDFSTGEGNEKGWDWNLARRMKEWQAYSLQPDASRAQNIGEIGWSTGPGSVVKVPTFDPNRLQTEYDLV